MTLGGIPLEVSARINHCHTPIDVTFLVQSETTLLKNFNPNDNNDDVDDDETAVAEVKLAESCWQSLTGIFINDVTQEGGGGL